MTDIVFHRLDTVGSTNDIGKKLIYDGAAEGAVVLARHQTKGRGRLGKEWLDEPDKSLLMSMVLGDGLCVRDVPLLSFMASLSVAESLNSLYGINTAIKWPNDVLVNGKKICGILVECYSGRAVVGVGININQTTLPEAGKYVATSVYLETGEESDIDIAAYAVAGVLLGNYKEFCMNGIEDILCRWRKYMWGIGREAALISGGRTIRGIIRGIADDGSLTMLVDNEEKGFYSADSLDININ